MTTGSEEFGKIGRMHHSFENSSLLSGERLRLGMALLISFCVVPFAHGCGDCVPVDSLLSTAAEVIAPDPATASTAIARLRAAGPRGLDALLTAHAKEIAAMRAGTLHLDDPSIARLRAAIDAVAKQRDAFASGLFWHTSLEAAKADAARYARPILSLHLLGNLDEEFSCANSRFFRTTLYANSAVAKLLKETFVLHWQSERPAPRITVDFGNGRTLQRTITGNSVHYILDADGAVIDALPGLFDAETFTASLRHAAEVAAEAQRLSTAERMALYRQAHQDALNALEARWNADLSRLGIDALTFAVVRNDLADLALQSDRVDDLLPKVAALHRDGARLDRQSRALLTAKNPTAEMAGDRARAKSIVESPLLRAVRNLEENIALDSVRNEFVLHARVHRWLLDPRAAAQLEKFNTRVYAELFLTPADDPWLGLAPRDTVAALDGNGVR